MKRSALLLALTGALLAESPDASNWWKHVLFLADDKLEGRDTGSAGHKIAARYVAQEFERAGLKPAGAEGYSQPLEFQSQRIDESHSSLHLIQPDGEAASVKLGDDAYFSVRGGVSDSVEADLVFVGYGFAIPERKLDEFAGLDLRGKVVVYIRGGPRDIPAPVLAHAQSSSERNRALREAGAVGVIAISNPKSDDIPWERQRNARLLPAMKLSRIRGEDLALSVVWNPSHANQLFEDSGHSFSDLLKIAQENGPLPKFPLRRKIRARARVNTDELISENVAGWKEGTDPLLKKQYVVLSAHLDHVGMGKGTNGDQIFNGAMDNAAGIATLIEVAKALRERPLKRSVLFVAVTAEEKGLLGSQFFAKFPTVPKAAIAADLNFDMFLPLFELERLTVYGLEESTLGDAVRKVASDQGILVQADPEPHRNSFVRSDQYSFIREGIPALAFKVGYAPGSANEKIVKNWLRERYHGVLDDVKQPVDKEAAAQFNALMAKLTEAVADQELRPQWKAESFFRKFAH